MRKITKKSTFITAIALFTPAFTASITSAAVIGTLNFTNNPAGGLIISATGIDFALPVGGPNGSGTAGLGTNLTYTGGSPIAPGAPLTIVDLPGAPGAVIDFITLGGNPNLHFDLTLLGPGLANTVAATTLNPSTPASSPFVGSPLILQATTGGTSISFAASGIARDASGPSSTWSGLFTTQVAGLTPAQVQQTLATQGTIASTYSGEIRAVLVPEPASAVALLTATVLAGTARRRRTM